MTPLCSPRCHGLFVLIAAFAAFAAIPAGAEVLPVGPGQTYETIQAAVDAAAPSGDVITVAAGLYMEQVLIVGKDLTLQGAGAGVTTIASPPALVPLYDDGHAHYPVVGVAGSTVQIEGLSVDGAGVGDLHERFYGVLWRNAGGALVGVTVTGVRDEPLSSRTHGVAIALFNDDATPRALAVTDCQAADFQAGGLVVVAAAGTPLVLDVAGTAITGAGPTGVVVQNGMQVTGPDITATLDGNTVEALAWLGQDMTAVGLLLQDGTGDVTGNVLVGCQTAVYLNAAAMTVAGNEITVPRPTDFGYGLVLDNLAPGYELAARAARPVARPYAPEQRTRRAAKATLAMNVAGNTIALDPGLPVAVGTVGALAENRQGFDDLAVTIAGNTFVGLATAVIAADPGPSSGQWLAADLGDNLFFACTTGIEADLPLTADAELCWWGAVDGPGGDGPGSGSLVVGTVDVEPWRTDLTNLVCDPAELTLTELATEGTVTFTYTGGASGRIYGYSIDVLWDPAVTTADEGGFQRPQAGPFASATFFATQQIGAGHVRVDAALGGPDPGIYAGPLFTGEFALLAAAPDGATSAITMVVHEIRDNQNEPLAGLVPVDGVVEIDSTPVITGVVVTDTTIGSTEWTRDGHAISVVVTVIESALATLTCDLVAFGGPVLALEDATVDGDQYTWIFAGIGGTGDGPVAALVEATDVHAAVASDAGAITADNTPPAPLAGLLVRPGHEKVRLSWSQPVADAGSPLAGVAFRSVTWGNYPAYAGVLPDAPASIDEGVAIGVGPVSGEAFDWAVVPRDVYVLAGFVVDLVGNASGPGGTGAATNYWLGDTDGDGTISVITDVTALGEAYGTSLGEPGYDPLCDVGPTFSGSPRGIPNPQADGYLVQFEDMMVFALNFNVVGPDLKFAPGARPDLRWEQVDPHTWALSLAEASPGLKGVNLRAELPAGVRCQVTPGDLLAAQTAPIFLRNIPARGLDAGLAAIGAGEAIEGAGELVRVTFDGPVQPLAVTISARDLNNGELLLDGLGQVGPTVPEAYRLEQNFPNPFNPQTTITFALPTDGLVSLAVYSVDGRRVASLLDEQRPAGRHEVVWTGRDDAGRPVATGTYFYSLRAGEFRQVRKMTLAK